MSPFARILRAIRPDAGVRGLAACVLLWGPLVIAAIDLAFGGTHDFFRRWLIGVAIGDTVCLVCFGGSLLLRVVEVRVARWHKREPPPERGLAFHFAFSALLMPCALPLGLFVGARFAGVLGRTFTPGPGDFRTGLGFGVLCLALFFLHHARAVDRERARDLERARLEARVAALTAEMNPHMLFNALNTIASLIHTDPDRAEETVLALAEVYRGTLRAAGGATHSLSDELRLCEAYLRVEQARYGERLAVSVHVASDLEPAVIQVPVLLLQPIVENAVRHGIAPLSRGGRVTVDVDRLPGAVVVVVEDDGVGLGGSRSGGNGRALANCRERLRLTFGERAALDVAARTEGGTRARVSLPAEAIE